MRNFYAVREGFNPGIYDDLEEARAQIEGYPNAEWKGFNVYGHAEEYLGGSQVKSEAQVKRESDQFSASTNSTSSRHTNARQGSTNKIHYVIKDMIFDDLSVARNYATGSFIQECCSMQDAINQVGRNGYRNYIKGFVQDLSYINDQGDRIYLVYTDGACPKNGQPDAAAGYGVFFGNNNPLNVSARLRGVPQTNQRAELAGIKRALEILSTREDGRMYQICTDSEYAINSLNKWAVTWQRNGWLNTKGMPVSNRDLIEDIVNLNASCLNVIGLRKVLAHSDCDGNNQADKLARDGVHRAEY